MAVARISMFWTHSMGLAEFDGIAARTRIERRAGERLHTRQRSVVAEGR
jgi:hypothetical protein